MYPVRTLCILWVGVKAWSLGVVMGCRIGEKVWSGTGNASKYFFF